MLTVGLTGKTGAGKGEFCLVAQKYDGVFCLDTDVTAREVVRKGSACLNELCEYFGNEILLEEGSLNRKKLATKAFSHEKDHEKLNSITHKYIMEGIREWLCECKRKNAHVAIIDAPLLFESGADKLCDKVICVISSKETRKDRIIKRDNIDESDADVRINSQKSDDFYIQKSDYVLYNDKDKKSFEDDCENLIKKLVCKV